MYRGRSVVVLALLLGLSPLGLVQAGAGSLGPGGAADAAGGTASLRLSGVVAMGGEPRFAVLELPGRGGRLVRVGDTLADGAEVLEIGHDWIRLSARGAERLLRLSGLPAGAAADLPPAAPALDSPGGEDAPYPGVLTVEDELRELIAGVAADEANSVEALADVIGAYLGLPRDAEITVSDMGFAPFAGAAAAKANLDQTGMLRVQIGEGEGMQMLYLRARPPDEAAPTGEEESLPPE